MRKMGPVLAAMMLASGSAFAQSQPVNPPAPAPLAPGTAAGLHTAQNFYPSDTLIIVVGVGLVVGGLLLTQLHYNNPAAPHSSGVASASSTN
ncbi:MAG TPA: hypothetical protein VIJ85_07815 [Rhizomicrobium sp.]